MGKLSSVTPEEERKNRDQDAAQLAEDELDYQRDPEFEQCMTDAVIECDAKIDAEKFLRHQKAEIYRALSEKYKQVLKERKLAAAKGAKIEFDEEMRTELRTAVELQWNRFVQQDKKEAERLFYQIDRIEEEQERRRKEDAKALKASSKEAKKAKDYVKDQLRDRRTPKPKSNCCVLF